MLWSIYNRRTTRERMNDMGSKSLALYDGCCDLYKSDYLGEDSMEEIALFIEHRFRGADNVDPAVDILLTGGIQVKAMFF